MFNDEPKKVYQQHIRTDAPETSPQQTPSTSPQPVEKPKKVEPMKQIVSLVVVALIAGASFYFAQRITTPVPTPEKSSASGLYTVRMLNVYYIPSDSAWTGKSPQIDILSFSTRIYVENASSFHGDTSKQMISFVEPMLPVIRYKKRLASDDSVQVYTDILTDTDGGNGKSLCQIIQEKSIDQVWLWVDSSVDHAAGSEFLVINSTSNFGALGYSQICPNTRTFTLMGLDYHSPIQNAMHSFGHYLEYLMRWMQGDDLILGRFQGVQNGTNVSSETYVYPPYVLAEKCGNVHTPPNIPINGNTYAGYEYDMPNTVNSSCDNWNPDGTGTKAAVNSNTWKKIVLPTTPYDEYLNVTDKGGKVQIQYLTWWMQNFNHESANLFYNGRRIPTWWAFVANTDNVINYYLNDKSYWMNPDLHAPVAATQTAFCTNQSGTYSNCTYTPGSSTLGAHTENDPVLAATTYDNIALVTVGYGHPTATVASVTFCGAAMTRIGTGPGVGGGNKTEMWYKISPQSGVCPISVRFTSDPGQRVVSSTIFNNIDQVTPISGVVSGGFSGPYTANPGLISATLTGPKDSLMICGYTHYSEQSGPPSANFAKANSGTTQLWKFEEPTYPNGAAVNNWAGLGAGVQRAVANQSTTLAWTTVKQQPSSYVCANFNVKPMVTTATPPPATPSPTPPPVTPTPGTPPPTTALPTVDLRAGISNMYLFDATLQTLLPQTFVLSWTSTNATSCKTLAGMWDTTVITRPTSGSVKLYSGVGAWSLSCTGANGTAIDTLYGSSTKGKVSVPVVGLFANNVNTGSFDKLGTNHPLVIKKGTALTISWETSGVKTCTASGSWTGAKASTGGSQSLGGQTVVGQKTYTITCSDGVTTTTSKAIVTVQ